MKIMKSISVLLVGGLCLLSGCLDLNHEEFSNISSDDFPKSEADYDASLIGVYNTLSNSYVQSGMDNCGAVLNMLPTDELCTAWEHTWRQQDRFLWTANDCAAPKNVYFKYQKGITKATKILSSIDAAPLSESKRVRYKAELRAIRALYMYQLFSLFGPVPVVTDPKVANDITTEWKPSRPTREQMFSLIESELKESLESLPSVYAAAEWGHISKGAALTLLMKLYLNEKQFDKANSIADRIIQSGNYQLMKDYKAVFDVNNEGPSNTEVIFSIGRLSSNSDYGWTWFACVMPPSPMYASSYIKTIWGGLKMPWKFYDKYEAGDKRLETIIRYYKDKDGKMVDYREVNHPKAVGAVPMKYSEDPQQKGAVQSNDFIMYRYADVLLVKAECLNEIEGPTDEAVSFVNQIRKRAGVKEIQATDFTKDSFRKFILDERGRELYCEGHRREDLIRHGCYIQYALDEGIDAKPWQVLFPIPQDALNENSNLVQNTGYEGAQ